MWKTLTAVRMDMEVASRSVSTKLDQVWSAAAREGIHETVEFVTVSIEHPSCLLQFRTIPTFWLLHEDVIY